MTIGATVPYRRPKHDKTGRLATGSLVFDLHRPVNRAPQDLEAEAATAPQAPRKTPKH